MKPSVASPRIAILCPVHKDVRFVASQIDNYFAFHGDSAIHVLHLSRSADPEISDIRKYLRSPAKVLINDVSWQTSYSCIFGAILSNGKYLRHRLGGWATHVYIHTDGDLLVHGDLSQYVANRGQAYSGHELLAASHWIHYEACKRDPVFAALRADLGIEEDQIFFGRQEGAFFEIREWERMLDVALNYFASETFEDVQEHWPREESVIPTLMKLIANDQTMTGIPVVRTKELKFASCSDLRGDERNVVQPDDICAAIATAGFDECIGIKWFSRDLDHPARKYLAELIRNRVT